MLAIILGIFTLGVILSLIFGLGNMAVKDNKARRKRSNKLMQLRIALQIGAIVTIFLLVFLVK